MDEYLPSKHIAYNTSYLFCCVMSSASTAHNLPSSQWMAPLLTQPKGTDQKQLRWRKQKPKSLTGHGCWWYSTYGNTSNLTHGCWSFKRSIHSFPVWNPTNLTSSARWNQTFACWSTKRRTGCLPRHKLQSWVQKSIFFNVPWNFLRSKTIQRFNMSTT